MNPNDPLKEEKLRLSISVRPSFTLENANRFRPIFDSLIDSPRDIFINPKSVNLSFSTLKHRIGEAIRWLMLDTSSQDAIKNKNKTEDYILLRAKIKFAAVIHEVEGQEVAGIMIKFKVRKNPVFDINDIIESNEIDEAGEDRSAGGGRLAKSKEIKSFESKRYRAKILEFLEDVEASYLHIKGIAEVGGNLTAEDKEWIEKTFDGTGIEFEVGSQEIKAVK